MEESREREAPDFDMPVVGETFTHWILRDSNGDTVYQDKEEPGWGRK